MSNQDEVLDTTEAAVMRLKIELDFKNRLLEQLDDMIADPNKLVSETYLLRRHKEVRAEYNTLWFKFFTAESFFSTKVAESTVQHN